MAVKWKCNPLKRRDVLELITRWWHVYGHFCFVIKIMVKSRFLSAPHDIAQQQRRLEIKKPVWDHFGPLAASERARAFLFPRISRRFASGGAACALPNRFQSNIRCISFISSAFPKSICRHILDCASAFYGVFPSSQMRDAIVIRAIGDYFAY